MQSLDEGASEDPTNPQIPVAFKPLAIRPRRPSFVPALGCVCDSPTALFTVLEPQTTGACSIRGPPPPGTCRRSSRCRLAMTSAALNGQTRVQYIIYVIASAYSANSFFGWRWDNIILSADR